LFHQTIGFYLIAALLPITLINGGIAKILKHSNIKPNELLIIKQGHRILGWVTVALIKIPLVTGWV